jgi:hypothetical protein
MADGKEYPVPHRGFFVLPPRAAYVIVLDRNDPNDAFNVLPLLTMTGLHQSGNGTQSDTENQVNLSGSQLVRRQSRVSLPTRED